MAITLDFEVALEELSETNDIAPTAEYTDVLVCTRPVGRLRFFVDELNLSDYHSYDQTVCLMEFVYLMSYTIPDLGPKPSTSLYHYDGGGHMHFYVLGQDRLLLVAQNRKVVVSLEEFKQCFAVFSHKLEKLMKEHCPQYYKRISEEEGWLPIGWGANNN